MINISNFVSVDNPLPRAPANPPARARIGKAAGRIRNAAVVIARALADIPRRWLDRLFEKNDAEACSRGWQITKVHGGLGRRYRDPRFDTLAACSRCRGTGGGAGGPCAACLGSGRIDVRQPTDEGQLTGGVS